MLYDNNVTYVLHRKIDELNQTAISEHGHIFDSTARLHSREYKSAGFPEDFTEFRRRRMYRSFPLKKRLLLFPMNNEQHWSIVIVINFDRVVERIETDL